jgi:sucrose-6-phosphate hydrolase SacC (GH32 family)
MPSACGRALIIARELTVEGSELKIHPIKETEVLRKTHTFKSFAHPLSATTALAAGSQVEVRLSCTGASAPGLKGRTGIRTLQTKDGSQYTEIGYDFDKVAMYADHSHCCAEANTIVQYAPHVLSLTKSGVNTFELIVFVDGGLIEV